MSALTISQLAIPTIIGVDPEERKQPQTLYFDLTLAFDSSAAAKTDDLQHTINYAAVYDRLINHIPTTRFFLIEALAENVADLISREFPVSSLTITLTKQPKDLDRAGAVKFTMTTQVSPSPQQPNNQDTHKFTGHHNQHP